MNLFFYPITAEEHALGQNGWAAIKEHEDRLVDFSMIQNAPNADIPSAIVPYTFSVVYQGKVYDSYKKYIDMEGNRTIFSFYEVKRDNEKIKESETP